jgi:hypothetical protein
VISPDFSVYPFAHHRVNSWQLYRSLAVFGFWHTNGVQVIPSINWVGPSQIESDRDLYPNFNIIAVRCPNPEYYQEWVWGAEKINEVIKPEIVLHFGTKLGSEVWQNSDVFQFKLRGQK